MRQFWAQQPESTLAARRCSSACIRISISPRRRARPISRNSSASGLRNPADPCFSHLPRWATTAQCKLFWSDDFRAQVDGSARSNGCAIRCRRSSRRWHPFNRSEYLEAKTLLPSYLLSSQGDRMLMANSVEGRFPFLDHRLIEFANRLHPRYKMRVLREKHLLKETMRGRLPASHPEAAQAAVSRAGCRGLLRGRRARNM